MDRQDFFTACGQYEMNEEFFRYFGALSRVPRSSGAVQQVSDFCVRFAREHGLEVYQDETLNVIIRKPGTPGRENHPPVILQGHMDMVCDHEPGAPDPALEGVYPVTDGEWVWAPGTTLGGDDGIAVAYGMAILAATDIPHPPIEMVITVDEETGMGGATALDGSRLKGRILLNVDSEVEGVFTAGCAGGARLDMQIPLKRETASGTLMTLTVDGLQGGHSGVMINAGRANAIKVLGHVLQKVSASAPIRLLRLDGGQKDNAIPWKASAAFLLNPEDAEQIRETVSREAEVLKRQWAETEAGLSIRLEEETISGESAVTRDQTMAILTFLTESPNGVQSFVEGIPDLPETSLNLGVARTEGNTLFLCISTRSSVRGACTILTDRLQELAAPAGAECAVRGVYPPWEYRPGSPLQKICLEVYREQTGKEGVIDVIHAGLECGILSDKLPGLDAVSFGPDLLDIHTTRERMNVASARRTWDLLVEILNRL